MNAMRFFYDDGMKRRVKMKIMLSRRTLSGALRKWIAILALCLCASCGRTDGPTASDGEAFHTEVGAAPTTAERVEVRRFYKVPAGRERDFAPEVMETARTPLTEAYLSLVQEIFSKKMDAIDLTDYTFFNRVTIYDGDKAYPLDIYIETTYLGSDEIDSETSPSVAVDPRAQEPTGRVLTGEEEDRLIDLSGCMESVLRARELAPVVDVPEEADAIRFDYVRGTRAEGEDHFFYLIDPSDYSELLAVLRELRDEKYTVKEDEILTKDLDPSGSWNWELGADANLMIEQDEFHYRTIFSLEKLYTLEEDFVFQCFRDSYHEEPSYRIPKDHPSVQKLRALLQKYHAEV